MAGDNWGETAKNAGDDQLQILHFQPTAAMRDANAAFNSSVERQVRAGSNNNYNFFETAG